MELIQKELVRSRMYYELKEKYLMRKARPLIAIGLVFWLAWMWQMLNGLEYFAYQRVVVFN